MEMKNQNHPPLPHREYKDRLFKAIFGRDTDESKRWRLSLYNALNGTSYTDPDALHLNTIENVIYITMRNDISFLIDEQMFLWEQQSSYNPNMPLRGLMYFSQLYQIYLTENRKSILSSKIVKIPTPKFIVFYNGSETEPGSRSMKLSDAFIREDKSGDFEWTAKIININPKCSFPLQKNCRPLYDYISYVYRVKENRKSGIGKKESVEEAVDWAIREKLLNGFFKKQRAEVIGMSLTEFDMEEFKRVCYEDGVFDKAVEAAENLLREGDSPEKIARCTGLPLEKVLELSEKISVNA